MLQQKNGGPATSEATTNFPKFCNHYTAAAERYTGHRFAEDLGLIETGTAGGDLAKVASSQRSHGSVRFGDAQISHQTNAT